jgi:indole-3-glycerol phosphate synthase
MSGFLDEMARASAARVPTDLAAQRRAASDAEPAPPLNLGSYGIIAEVKWASPSAGALTAAPSDRAAATAQRAAAYASAGAAAISVLTEPSRFHGDLSLLRAAATASDVPVMCKDFLVAPAQLFEARAAGAGGALLIVRMLSDGQLSALLGAAEEANLWVLLEAFDGEDLDRIAALPVAAGRLAGLNCRNLQTLSIEPDRFAALSERLPPGLPAVAESGLVTPADIRATAEAGYRAALVGSALMRAADPAAQLAALVAAGRQACS